MATRRARTQRRSSMTVREAGRKGGQRVQEERAKRDRKEVRHRAYDKPGPPKGTAFGIAALTQALDGLEFPATRQDLMRHARNKKVEYRKGQPVALAPLIEDLDEDEFPSMANVVEALSDALREEGLTSREDQRGAHL